ncbi:hypothetical protein ACVU7I_06585, partial [Patulibacter sp. S7RM1-6]
MSGVVVVVGCAFMRSRGRRPAWRPSRRRGRWAAVQTVLKHHKARALLRPCAGQRGRDDGRGREVAR